MQLINAPRSPPPPPPPLDETLVYIGLPQDGTLLSCIVSKFLINHVI